MPTVMGLSTRNINSWSPDSRNTTTFTLTAVPDAPVKGRDPLTTALGRSIAQRECQGQWSAGPFAMGLSQPDEASERHGSSQISVAIRPQGASRRLEKNRSDSVYVQKPPPYIACTPAAWSPRRASPYRSACQRPASLGSKHRACTIRCRHCCYPCSCLVVAGPSCNRRHWLADRRVSLRAEWLGNGNVAWHLDLAVR